MLWWENVVFLPVSKGVFVSVKRFDVPGSLRGSDRIHSGSVHSAISLAPFLTGNFDPSRSHDFPGSRRTRASERTPIERRAHYSISS